MDRIKTSQPAIVDAAVLHNEQVAPRYHLLSLRLDVSSGETSWLQGVAPGQFVQVDCRPAGILLRRPISIYKWSREELCLMLLVQRVGCGSNYMCDLKVGDRMNIVGPLGTPFATDPTIAVMSHANTKTTIVRSAVAISESVSLSPHFASIEVSPAKTADPTAAINHIRSRFHIPQEKCLNAFLIN